MEPAVRFDRLPGGGGVVEILAEDVRPAHEDSPSAPMRISVPGSAFPRCRLVPLEPVDRRDRGGLREPVPLEDENADGVQELGDLPGQGRPSEMKKRSLPPIRSRIFRKTSRRRSRSSRRGAPAAPRPAGGTRRLAADPEGPLEDRLLQSPVLLDLRQHAGVELLVEPGTLTMISGRTAARSSATVWRERAKEETAIASKARKCSSRPRSAPGGGTGGTSTPWGHRPLSAPTSR